MQPYLHPGSSKFATKWIEELIVGSAQILKQNRFLVSIPDLRSSCLESAQWLNHRSVFWRKYKPFQWENTKNKEMGQPFPIFALLRPKGTQKKTIRNFEVVWD